MGIKGVSFIMCAAVLSGPIYHHRGTMRSMMLYSFKSIHSISKRTGRHGYALTQELPLVSSSWGTAHNLIDPEQCMSFSRKAPYSTGFALKNEDALVVVSTYSQSRVIQECPCCSWTLSQFLLCPLFKASIHWILQVCLGLKKVIWQGSNSELWNMAHGSYLRIIISGL